MGVLCYDAVLWFGSLVPLAYVDRRWWSGSTLRISHSWCWALNRGADWVANGVLYVPVGFLTAAWLTQTFIRYLAPFCSWRLSLNGVGVGVEFTQLFFPAARSLNDIMAECIWRQSASGWHWPGG
jgi:hypothetical protein